MDGNVSGPDDSVGVAISAMARTIAEGIGPESLKEYRVALGRALQLVQPGSSLHERVRQCVADDMKDVHARLSRADIDRDEHEAAVRLMRAIEDDVLVNQPSQRELDHAASFSRHTEFSRPAAWSRRP